MVKIQILISFKDYFGIKLEKLIFKLSMTQLRQEGY